MNRDFYGSLCGTVPSSAKISTFAESVWAVFATPGNIREEMRRNNLKCKNQPMCPSNGILQATTLFTYSCVRDQSTIEISP